jgi:PKD repeat protein
MVDLFRPDALEWTWDFGDGATATGPTVSHTYRSRTYDATMVVTDVSGLASRTSVQVTVSAPNAARLR